MRKLSRLEALPSRRALAMTIGTFDGLHLGHQRVLARLRERSRSHAGGRLPIVLLSIDNRGFKDPGGGALLDPLHRLDLLEELGVDYLVTLPFARVRHLGYEAFLRRVTERANLAYFCASEKLRIGRGRLGTPPRVTSALARLAPASAVEYLPSVNDPGGDGPIAASKIRQFIREGGMERAAKLLGRPYRLEGRVLAGKRLGRTLGFPTLNQAPDPSRVMPREGVYLTRVTVAGFTRPALSFLGRPWIQQKKGAPPPPPGLESYLLNFKKSVYNRGAQVEFLQYVRENRRFSGVDELKRQMDADLAFAKRFFRGEPALTAP